MEDMKKKAKLKDLEGLKQVAMDMMGDNFKRDKSELEGLKKVTVAAPDKEGLEKGLEKAKELASSMPELEDESMEDESTEEIESESPTDESLESMDKEELMHMMDKIKEMLAKK
jgi:peptidyl-tRNA hydrolase